MRLGETILKKRTARGLSQEKLAELVGVSRQAVSKWEVGDAIPDTDKLIPLARALGISVDELLGNVPEEAEQEGEEAADESPVSDASVDGQPVSEKRPGWFATHWYWLGLIPVIWGTVRLLYLIVMLILVLVNVSVYDVGFSEVLTEGVGAAEIITSAETSVID